MKVNWNKKYTTIAIYSFIVICLSLVFYQIISDLTIFKLNLTRFMKVMHPFLIGFVMAYLFNFVLKFYEKKLFDDHKYKRIDTKAFKLKRNISMALTYLTIFIIVYVFSNFVFPQVMSSIVGIANNMQGYIEETSQWLLGINEKLALNQEYSKIMLEKWDEIVNYGIDFATNLIPMFANIIKSTLSSLWNIILGIIVSIYLLVEKEKFIGLTRKITISLFSEKRADRLMEITNRANMIFSKFIVGKILDSFIVGIMTFGILKLLNIPFAVLVSFIVGLTNIIPFFGPFIGAVPSTIIILFESPIKALWFIIVIIVIQQIDGNIIGPKILGESLGISAFWILFSLLITGKLLGFIGLVIGVPLFALIYSILKDRVDEKLRVKGLSDDIDDYI